MTQLALHEHGILTGLPQRAAALGSAIASPDSRIPQTIDADELDARYFAPRESINTMSANDGRYGFLLAQEHASASGAFGASLRVLSAPVLPPALAAQKYFWGDAEEQLADLDNYAAEKEVPLPSPVAKKLARRLLMAIIPVVPRYYGISPWEDGDVAIQANGAKGYGVSVCCRANGGASLYVVRPEGCVHQHHYHPPETISAAEIAEILEKMPA